MPRNFSDPKFMVRAILGALLGANLVGAGMVLFPPGGSADDLERQLASLQSQVMQNKALLERTRQHAAAVEKGRAEGDKFLNQYFLDRRTASATLETALVDAAAAAKIKPREHAWATQPIEGSDTLSMWSVTYSFEGTPHDVMSFVHEIDRSSQFLIIESLNATPQQGANASNVTVTVKIDAFVREEPGP
jgi:hypothetical protein